jgi:hypothetical protein
MNKKLEQLGRLFLDDFLIKYDIYIDPENSTIEYIGDDQAITVAGLYMHLMELFQELSLMDRELPVISKSVFTGIEVVNGWEITYKNKTYKNGDEIT